MEEARDIFKRLRRRFAELLDDHELAHESVSISARPLSPGEAIGNPEADDYAILRGKERMMQATFRGSKGQAFSDMSGEWSGKVSEAVRMELTNNFRRAVFIASLNAVMRHLGLVDQTIHCKDDGPIRCARRCLEKLSLEASGARITMIGYQPRIVEFLSGRFKLSVVDLDKDNIGRQHSGVIIFGPKKTEQALEEADILLVTGTTLVNGTFTQFLNDRKKTIFYGVTIASAAALLGLQRFCPFGL